MADLTRQGDSLAPPTHPTRPEKNKLQGGQGEVGGVGGGLDEKGL